MMDHEEYHRVIASLLTGLYVIVLLKQSLASVFGGLLVLRDKGI